VVSDVATAEEEAPLLGMPVPLLKLASLVPSMFHLAAEGSHCSPKTTDQDAYATGSYSFPTRTIEFNLKVFILHLLHIS